MAARGVGNTSTALTAAMEAASDHVVSNGDEASGNLEGYCGLDQEQSDQKDEGKMKENFSQESVETLQGILDSISKQEAIHLLR